MTGVYFRKRRTMKIGKHREQVIFALKSLDQVGEKEGIYV